MPLSEHEERALEEIARHLSEEDPKFVATVSNSTVTRLHLRRVRRALVGFLVGLLGLLGLTFHFAFGLVGFTLMLASLIYGARALRNVGGVGAVVEEIRRSVSRRDA